LSPNTNPDKWEAQQFKGIDIQCLDIDCGTVSDSDLASDLVLDWIVGHRRNNRSFVNLQFRGNMPGFQGNGFQRVYFYQAGLTSQQFFDTNA